MSSNSVVSLGEEISAWDGKSAEDIGKIFRSHKQSRQFVNTILELLPIQSLSKGATWLLKAWLEEGNSLNVKQAHNIYVALEKLDHWESRLHVLQSFPYLTVSKSDKLKVEVFLRNCLSDNNKFVRAWTYNGWHLLALQYPEYREEVDEFLEMAMRDEAPSVKARIRNIKRET